MSFVQIKETSVGFLNTLFGGRRERSSDVARERLLTVLVHDRVKLTPDMLDQLKAELSAVIAKYVPAVEPGEIEVTLMRGESNDHIKADIPLRRST
jgi:cell division topological specificity factor